MSSLVAKMGDCGRIENLGCEGTVPEGLQFYWEDERGSRYYFADVTKKQARKAVRESAKMLFNRDDMRAICSSAWERGQGSNTVTTVAQVKELRRNTVTRFAQFHPKGGQLKIGLAIVKELTDCFIGYIYKCLEGESVSRMIYWDIEYLPGDGGIYQMLLKGGKNEGFHNNQGQR